MNQQLKILIESYLSAVNEAAELLQASGIELPKSNIEWATSGIKQCGELKHGIKYFKHGYGCAVHLPSGTVDFDFGTGGEYNGFDMWRHWGFLQNANLPKLFKNESELKQEFSIAVKNGDLKFSGYVLHYLNEVDL